MAGVTEGRKVEASPEEAVEEARPVLHPFEPGLDQGGELADVVLGRVAQGSFETGPGVISAAGRRTSFGGGL